MKQVLATIIAIAANKHKNQFDKGGKPYILHCMAVMEMLAYTGDYEIMSIGIGHDLFEDTDTTTEELRAAGITERVIKGILNVTKMPGETFEEYKTKVKSSKDSILVKMKDLRHNSDLRRLKGVTEKDTQRTIKYMKFYKELEEYLKELE